ncbi:MAG: DUF3789 domain-containing protein [Ruminococcus sp.]|nr:DUF3789 domain-containing protein [Ruminococcus sp.]
MIGFVLGSVIGGTVGMVTMCMCTAAKWGDGDDNMMR